MSTSIWRCRWDFSISIWISWRTCVVFLLLIFLRSDRQLGVLSWSFSHETNAMVGWGFDAWQVGTDKDYLASSIAYRLDLHGTAEVGFFAARHWHQRNLLQASDSMMGYDSYVCFDWISLSHNSWLGRWCRQHAVQLLWLSQDRCSSWSLTFAMLVCVIQNLPALNPFYIWICLIMFDMWIGYDSMMVHVHVWLSWISSVPDMQTSVIKPAGEYREEQSCVTNYVVTVKHWIRQLRTMHSVVVHPSHLMHLSLLWMVWFGHQMEFLDSALDID